MQRVTAEQKAELDLPLEHREHRLEPISRSRHAAIFGGVRIVRISTRSVLPSYGLAEATLFVAAPNKAELPRAARSALPPERGQVGWTAADCRRTHLGWLRPGLAGAGIGHRSPGVLRAVRTQPSAKSGYAALRLRRVIEQAEETRRTFHARIADNDAGPFLRTGDLGFIDDGQLFITGRLKDIIVIHGRNHYPQDIEATVQALHPSLRPEAGAAFETGPDGQARLVIVQEVNRRARDFDPTKLAGDIRQTVAERHDLQVHDVQFLEAGSLPRTSSGKIQRHACRASYNQGTLRRWKGP